MSSGAKWNKHFLFYLTFRFYHFVHRVIDPYPSDSDITNSWFSCLPQMLCQAFVAATLSCFLFVDLSALWFVTEKIGSKSGEADLSVEECPISLLGEGVGLLWQRALGHCSFALWNAARSVLQDLTESEQRVLLCHWHLQRCLLIQLPPSEFSWLGQN